MAAVISPENRKTLIDNMADNPTPRDAVPSPNPANAAAVSALDRALARVCVHCPLCRRARQKQAGVAFWLVKKVEASVCPFCRAYAKVYGQKS